MEKRDVRIIFMGTPTFAVTQLDALLEENYNVVAVVTAPDKPAGRGMQLVSSEVKKFAISRSIPVLQPTSLKNESFLAELSSYKADLFVVVAFRMLPKEVWAMPRLGTFNLHASLLPDYRGAAPINHVIINGETVTGVTTFMLDEKIDNGAILHRQECSISPEDNFGTLHDKLLHIGKELIIKSIEEIISGTIKPVPQSLIVKDIATLHTAPKITKEMCKIDWNMAPEKIHNLVRGLSPYPGAYSTLSGKGKEIPVKIFKTEFVNENHRLSMGTILTDKKEEFKVACKEGSIKIIELQIAGKRKMSVKDFLAGFRDLNLYTFIQ